MSYSRKDRDFVRQLNDALVAQKREAWVDWKDIPLTAEWQQEILTNIEIAENFVFVISPESVASRNCRKEIDHAVANSKRMIPIYRRPVPDDTIPEGLSKFQRIDFGVNDDFDAKFATLIGALDTDLDWVKAHTRLLTRAIEWEREGKDGSFLLQGKDLRDAERWVARGSEKEPKLTILQSRHILASRESATKRQRVIIGGVAIAFLIAVGLAVYAFIQKNVAQRETLKADANATEAKRQEGIAKKNEAEAKRQEGFARDETTVAQRNARESRARELSVYANESLGNDPERSILLGMEAVSATLHFGERAVPSAEDALHRALLSSFIQQTLPGHSYAVWGLAFSRDGNLLATASGDKTLKLWDLANGREVAALKSGEAFMDVVFSPDGRRLATARGDGRVILWEAASGQELVLLRYRVGNIKDIVFSSDGKSLATSGDRGATIWDVESGLPLARCRGHTEDVYGLAFSSDGKSLATASADNSVRVWNADSGEQLRMLPLTGARSVAFSPDGRRLAAAGLDAKVWDVAKGQELLSLRGHTASLSKIAFSPDGKRLMTASIDHSARVWDAKSGHELFELRGHAAAVMSAAFSPDGKRIATGDSDGTVKVWDATGPHELPAPLGQPESVQVTLSPNGRLIATASLDGTAKLWDAVNGKDLRTFGATLTQSSGLLAVAFSPDGLHLAAGGADGVARIWDIASTREVQTLRCHSNARTAVRVVSIAFSPDGTRIATACTDHTANIWNPVDGRLLVSLKGHSDIVTGVVFSSDGQQIATASFDGTAQLWDATTGKELRTFGKVSTQLSALLAVAFSPDGRHLAAAGADGLARIWDVASTREVQTLRGHLGRVYGVTFSPDGRYIATAGGDHNVKVWDAGTGQELLSLPGHSTDVIVATFSSDGKHLVSGANDGTVQIYTMDVHELLRLARKRVRRTRLFTAEECRRYFQRASCHVDALSQ
jgi:WD40 repeat protein